MTNEKIKTAAEVVTGFLDEQAQNDNLDPGTVKAISRLRNDGKLTKINLLRQLEALRKAVINVPDEEGPADD